MRRFMALLMLLTLATAATASVPTKVRSIEGVTEYRLENGLQVLLIPDASQATVTVNITIFAGSMHEGYGETGSAHLLEHLVFKGTPEFPNPPGAMNEHGASWNGTTWTDRTNYFETMPSSDENLEFGIRFEASRLVSSHIRKSDLESEMTVVRNEFEMGENSPTSVLSERMNSAAFAFHGYGHSTIGARSDIENIPIERLEGFYRRYYQPDNALLIVAGRFDQKKALEYIARSFGAIPRPERVLVKPYTVEPAQDGERSVTLRRVGEVGAAGALYHVPAGSHPDAAAIEVASHILGSTPSGRLYKKLVETQRAVGVWSYVFQWRDPGIVQFMSEVRKGGSLTEVSESMLSIIEGLGTSELDPAEVERARNALLKQKTLLFNRSERLAVEMSEWAAMGDWRLFFVHRDRIQDVKPADVTRVARAYLTRNNRTAGLFVPTDEAQRAAIPATGDLTTMLAKYQGQAAEGLEAEAFDISPGNLEQRTQRVELPNGMQLALLPKQTRGGAVTASFRLYVGNEADLADKTELNSFVASMLDRGTSRHTRQQLRDELDRLKAQVRVFGSTNATNVSLTTTRESLGEASRLVMEMLKEPTFDAAEFELLKQQRLASLEEALHEPMALAGNALGHHLYPEGHISYQPTLEQQMAYLEGLELASLKAFHRDYYGAGAGYAAAVGDFDAKAFQNLADKELGSWRSPKRSERVEPGWPGRTKPVNEAIQTPDKENSLTLAGLNFQMTQEDPDYPALMLANYMLGGEQLNSVLAKRLRQQDGLCYGAGSSASVDPTSDLGSFRFYAISAPQNVPGVERGFTEELDRFRTKGVTKEELARSRELYLKRLDLSLSRDRQLAGRMLTDMIRGKDFKDLARWQSQIGSVSLEDLSQAAKLLDPARMALFKAGDFAKAAPAEEKVAADQ